MKYNGTDFNEQWVLSLTLKQFIDSPATQHLFKGDNRVKQLIEVYNIIHHAHNL